MSTVLPGNALLISGYWLGVYGINTLHPLVTGEMSTVIPGNTFQIVIQYLIAVITFILK
jgi:hypothetical protein